MTDSTALLLRTQLAAPVVLATPAKVVRAESASASPVWSMRRGKTVGDSSALVRFEPTTLAAVPKISGLVTATKSEPFVSRYVKRPVVTALSGLSTIVKRRITAETQIQGGKWLAQLPKGQPLVWLMTHQTTLDFVNLFPLQQHIPGTPDLKIASRTFGCSLGGKLLSFFAKPFIFHLHRTSMGDGATKEQKEALKTMSPAERTALEAKLAEKKAALQAVNDVTMSEIRARFGWGGHVAMFPEGTTMTDGRVFKVKKGFCSLIRVPQADGTEQIVPIAPVGYTLDLLAGPPGKYLNFVKIGEPIVYEPQAPLRGESAEAYRRRDGDALANLVHAKLLSLSTVTASQLAGVALLRKIESGTTELRPTELLAAIHRTARRASEAGYAVDAKLLDAEDCRARFTQLWANLEAQGYIRVDGKGRATIDAERLGREKLNADYDVDHPLRYNGYKQANPLRYCANRLLQVCAADERMRAITSAL